MPTSNDDEADVKNDLKINKAESYFEHDKIVVGFILKGTRRRKRKLHIVILGFIALAVFAALVLHIITPEIFGSEYASDSQNPDSEEIKEPSDTQNFAEESEKGPVAATEPVITSQIFTNFNDGTLDDLILTNRGETSKLSLKTSWISFEKSIIASNFDSARSVHSVDIDLDGDNDVLGAARYIHRIALWKNEGTDIATGKVNFTEHIIDGEFQGAFSVHGADLDNDGYKDVIGASLYDEQIAWWRNNQDGTFSARHIIDSYFDGAIFVFCADIDNDGNIDVLTAGEAVDQIAWWRNTGGGIFDSRIVIGDKFTGARSVHAADVDGDGDIDVLGTARFDDKVVWWENNGDGKEFIEHILDDRFDGPRSVHATDLDNDGDIDVLAAARYSHQIALWDNDGEQNFTKILIDNSFEGATNVYSADIDRDGRKDIVAAAVYANKVAWWQNEGNGRFNRHIIGDNFLGATFVYAEDINGDEYKDVIAPAVFDNQIALWINQPRYDSSGVFISPVFKRIANMRLENIQWQGFVPDNASLKFQIRSAYRIDELETADWYGPTAVEGYYTKSNSIINPIHNKHLFMQYRVIFGTKNEAVKPELTKVVIRYTQ